MTQPRNRPVMAPKRAAHIAEYPKRLGFGVTGRGVVEAGRDLNGVDLSPG